MALSRVPRSATAAPSSARQSSSSVLHDLSQDGSSPSSSAARVRRLVSCDGLACNFVEARTCRTWAFQGRDCSRLWRRVRKIWMHLRRYFLRLYGGIDRFVCVPRIFVIRTHRQDLTLVRRVQWTPPVLVVPPLTGMAPRTRHNNCCATSRAQT